MALAEFFGCTFIAFGLPFAMFVFTVANDSIRIIILIAAAFFWLVSLLLSSLLWFVLIPLREYLVVGVCISVALQECFRYGIYRILRRTQQGLQEVSDNSSITENKHILSYVSGLGFGVISGIFALINILADMMGPGTMGLTTGDEYFFLVSAVQTLAIIMLHTFWSVIFFNACDQYNYWLVSYVFGSHLLVSMITLMNMNGWYWLTISISYLVTAVTVALAFKTAGASVQSLKRFLLCQ